MDCRWTILFATLLPLASGCGSGEPAADEPVPPVSSDTDAGDSVEVGDSYRVRFDTTAGEFVVQVHPDWAPRGAERFRKLVEAGFYDDVAFFRVVEGFMVQFGLSGDPNVNAEWQDEIPDDPVVKSNERGTVTFAMAGPNSRTTQVFVNYKDNSSLDDMGFAPFGKVVEGMDVVDAINAEHGERPNQGRIQAEGNTYLRREFPGLDYVKTARVVDSEDDE